MFLVGVRCVGMWEIALTQQPGTCHEIWDFGLGLLAMTGTVARRSRPVAVIRGYGGARCAGVATDTRGGAAADCARPLSGRVGRVAPGGARKFGAEATEMILEEGPGLG